MPLDQPVAPSAEPSGSGAVPGVASAPGSSIPVPGSSAGDSSGSSGSSNGAAIGGGIAGGIIGLVLLALLAYFLLARRRRQGRDAAIVPVSGGKGDIESASDTGSSPGRGGSGSSPQSVGCWPFGRSLRARPAHQVGSPGSDTFSDTAFLPKGVAGSTKLNSAPMHANARGGSLIPPLAARLAAARGEVRLLSCHP